MFNHQTIFRFFSLVFIAWIFFGLSNVLWQCTTGTNWWYNWWSMPSPNTCLSVQTNQSSLDRYNNDQELLDGAKRFIVAYDLLASFDLSCEANNVRAIQNQMQIVWWACTTCLDWRFWKDTKLKLENSCSPVCNGTNKPVNINFQTPCDSWYTLDSYIWCCIPTPPPWWNNNTWWNNTWWNNTWWNNTWWNNPWPGLPSNITWVESQCGLPAWTLNPTTVTCVKNQWGGCCVDSGIRASISQWQTKPNLSFCPNANTPQNNCTKTWEVGTLSWGTTRSCKQCWSWKMANIDHTKCICDPWQWCCGIQLNTVVPFIWDCIEMSNEESAGNTTRVNPLNAFPRLMWWLSKIIVTAILIFSFVMVVVAWVLITSWGIQQENYKKWLEIIKKVIMALALLWASWIILRLINPNFFG